MTEGVCCGNVFGCEITIANEDIFAIDDARWCAGTIAEVGQGEVVGRRIVCIGHGDAYRKVA